MVILYCILFLFLLIPPAKRINASEDDYLSQDKTLPIKGFLTILVVFSHGITYVEFSPVFVNSSFVFITKSIGQLMVAPFLFFSGYGILEQTKRRGNSYCQHFFKKRILKTWISFAICVGFYCVYSFVVHSQYSLKEYLLAFTGWTSLGNSNWFMAVTFIMYILYFIVFNLFHRTSLVRRLIIFSICVVFINALFIFLKKEPWWWNTLMCFPLGMWFSVFRQRIDEILGKKNGITVGIVAAILVSFVVTYYLKNNISSVFGCACTVLFCLCVVILMRLIAFRSTALSFIGRHVFSIYILQRLPFMIFKDIIHLTNPYIYFFVCLSITILVAVAYDAVFNKLSTTLIKKSATQKI